MRPRDRVALALALALVTVPLVPAQPASAQSLYCERKVTFRTTRFGWFRFPEVTTRCTGAVAISMSWPGPVAPGGLSTARARLTVRWAGEFVAAGYRPRALAKIKAMDIPFDEAVLAAP